MRKLRFYRRIRNSIIGIGEKSNDRIILDSMIVSPIVNDKGTVVPSKNSVKKRSLRQSKTVHTRRTGFNKIC